MHGIKINIQQRSDDLPIAKRRRRSLEGHSRISDIKRISSHDLHPLSSGSLIQVHQRRHTSRLGAALLRLPLTSAFLAVLDAS